MAAALLVTAPFAGGPGAPVPPPVHSYGVTLAGEPTPAQAQTVDGLSYGDRPLLSGWTVAFVAGGDRHLLGATLKAQRRIEIHVDANADLVTLRMTVAHELGHALDLRCLDAAKHAAWMDSRASGADWWAESAQSDYATGSGDWAETFASWQSGGTSLSLLSDGDDGEQIALADTWLAGCR